MNELQELRKKIEKQDYQGALTIVNELEEMSLEDKLNKIYSYMVILLVHLIKQEAEKRNTSSWKRSISNSVKYINKTNKRATPRRRKAQGNARGRRAGGYYATEESLKEIIEEAYDHAIEEASYEAFEGKISVAELAQKVDASSIKKKALSLLEKE